VSDSAYPSQADVVYAAQEEAQEYWFPPDPAMEEVLTMSELRGFVDRTVAQSGCIADPPEIHFEVPDESDFAGWANDGGIHLHPRLLRPWTVLHELAHWLDLGDGHGARFCANFLSVVEAGLGRDAAEALATSFARFEVDVDENYAPDWWPGVSSESQAPPQGP
jgi:hypothetical protein